MVRIAQEAAVTLAGWLLLAGMLEPITLDEYRSRLVEIRAALDRADLKDVRARAASLREIRVRVGEDEIPTDGSVLEPLAQAKDVEAARAARGGLNSLIQALGALDATSPPAPDHAHLERLRRRQTPGEIRSGGELPQAPESLMERLRALIRDLAAALERLWRFILELFSSKPDPDAPSGIQGGVIILVIAIVLALGLTALFVFLKRRRMPSGELLGSSAPAARVADEDPLSRGASEWERLALEMAKAGRFREAVRAWYHAVLVTLFEAGAAHYRKGRTNWEYAYALSPAVAWRASFVEATRQFEREWYGGRATAADAAEDFAGLAQKLLRSVRSEARS
ncbi:MAG: DUF4129 domain-containing protein [Planctomycetes bacterium]|nr:DUF4129 domain-containing protein [Planctomycetota bacterium]